MTKVKNAIKKLAGYRLLAFYRIVKQRVTPGSGQDLQTIFSSIYRNNRWGGADGSYCSGEGSSLEHIISPYTKVITDYLDSIPESQRHVVDLGCGDFQVGGIIAKHCSTYVGADVVPDVIEHNQKTHGSEAVSFRVVDITSEELPEGKICLIRQVLQHLSNDQVVSVLSKLSGYESLFITEHYPGQGRLIRRNLDKHPGKDVRALYGSGVYLDHPPFNIHGRSITKILEVAGSDLGEDTDPGLIITYQLT